MPNVGSYMPPSRATVACSTALTLLASLLLIFSGFAHSAPVVDFDHPVLTGSDPGNATPPRQETLVRAPATPEADTIQSSLSGGAFGLPSGVVLPAYSVGLPRTLLRASHVHPAVAVSHLPRGPPAARG